VFLASTEAGEEDATAGKSVYVFENWTPLQRPAKALAAALRDAALWGAFGIKVRVRPAWCPSSCAGCARDGRPEHP
jgi:hypothetical protein